METNKDRLQLAQKYVVEDPTLPLDGLKDKEIKTVLALRSLYDYVHENPNASIKERREFLTRQDGIGDTAAYRYIAIVETLVGSETPRSKQFAKFRVQALMDEEYAYVKAENYNAAKAIHLLIQDYVKTYRLDIDEGEAFDAAKRAEFERIEFTTDLEAIGIGLTPEQKKANDRLKRENNYEDIDFVEILNSKDE
jgi:hypothetical protein